MPVASRTLPHAVAATRTCLMLACLALGWPAAASAQALSNPDKAPTSPTADDPSVGIPSSPATTASTPVPLKPDAAHKDGAGGYVPDANVPARDKR